MKNGYTVHLYQESVDTIIAWFLSRTDMERYIDDLMLTEFYTSCIHTTLNGFDNSTEKKVYSLSNYEQHG